MNNELILSFIPTVVYYLSVFGVEIYTKISKTKNSFYKENKNRVSRSKAFLTVLITLLLQIPTNYFLFLYFFSTTEVRFYYIFLGIFLIDTVEYFCHRLYHTVPWLYKNAHKVHHEMVVPYTYGALYNSALESIITSSAMLLGFYYFNFNFLEYIVTISLSYFCTVCDHAYLFQNKIGFHCIHHEINSNKNFQQPFFTFYDKLFGTYQESYVSQLPRRASFA